MPKTYVTVQDDTVDLACQKIYGFTAGVTELTLAANPGLADRGFILPMGVVIVMPDAPAAQGDAPLKQLWD